MKKAWAVSAIMLTVAFARDKKGLTHFVPLVPDVKLATAPYLLHLLPGLPPTWPNEKIAGLKARGGFIMDLEWRDGMLVQETIHASRDGASCVYSDGKLSELIVLKQGESKRLSSGTAELADNDELYAGPEHVNAFANPEDHPDRPNVLLIGDSISIGYTVDVRKRLHGKADVFRIPGNAKNSSFGLENLNTWLEAREWDIIHFNWGLWDLCYRNPESKTQGHRDKVNGTITTTPEQYGANLEKIVARLRETDATLIWCATTPVPDGEAGRKLGDDVKYNQIAEAVMKENGILINDLHAHALLNQSEIQKNKGDVHYTSQGYAYLAGQVELEIRSVLSK